MDNGRVFTRMWLKTEMQKTAEKFKLRKNSEKLDRN